MKISGERILLFGDSLSHHADDSAPEIWLVDEGSNRASSAPGDLLASILAEQGAQAVQIDANVGRSALNFWTGPNDHQQLDAASLIASDQAFSPTQVVVMLGTNDLGLDPTLDAQGFQAIKASFPNATVWAVGPPNFDDPSLNVDANIVYQTLQNVFGTGYVIDMRPLTMGVPRAGDGIHFTSDSAPGVAAGLFNVLATTNPIGWGTLALGALGIGVLVGVGVWIKRRENRALAGVDNVLEMTDKNGDYTLSRVTIIQSATTVRMSRRQRA